MKVSWLLVLICIGINHMYYGFRPPAAHSLPFKLRYQLLSKAAEISSSDTSSSNAGYIKRPKQKGPLISGATYKERAPNKQKKNPSLSTKAASSEWIKVFENLQNLQVRTLKDYERAFQICHSAGRPFECLSLIRYMAKDEITRPLKFYQMTASLAVSLENWATVLDTYIFFEKKEEFQATCLYQRELIKLALESCSRLGKGNRAVRLYDKAMKDLRPPMLECKYSSAVLVLRACLRAGTVELGLPLAHMILSSPKTEVASQCNIDLPTINVVLSTLAKSGHGEEALAHLRRLEDTWELQPDVVSYGAVMDGLLEGGKGTQSSRRQVESALALLKEMVQVRQIRPSPVMAHMLSATLVRENRLDDAIEILSEVPVKERGQVQRLQPLWVAATREGNVEAVEWLLQDLEGRAAGKKKEDMMSLTCYHSCLCNLARVGLYEQAEKLAGMWMEQALKEATPMTFYALVAACEKANAHERLLHWFQEMLKQKIEPDALRYGMALKACECSGKWQMGIALLTSMRSRKLEMHPILWKRLFLLLGREGRGQEALELLEELEAQGEELEVICYEATITAFSRGEEKNQLAVEQLIKFEEEKGLKLGRGAYTSVIASCRDVKDWQTALQLYTRMKDRSYEPPSIITRAALLDVLVASNHVSEDTVMLVREIDESGDDDSIPSHMRPGLIHVYSALEDYENVLRHFRSLWEGRKDPGHPLGWWVSNAALQACARVGDYPLALEIVRVLESHHRHARGPAVDVVMYGCILTACSTAGAWKEAFQILKKMTSPSSTVQPNLVCYTSVIMALQQGQEWRKALNLLLNMLNTGPSPDVQVYNSVLSACANAGETHMALKIFQAMKVHGVKPDDITYATAIVACWRGDEWRQAVEILSAMKADGFPPNMISVTLVIDVCDRNKKYDLAAYVFESSVVGYIRSEDYEMESAAGPGMVVDLHGYSQPVARAALRAGLKRLQQMYLNNQEKKDMIKDFIFITGVGRHSEMPFEPVLRPAMQEMLTRDFDPPLPCEMMENNPGRMVVRSKDLLHWLESQVTEKKKDLTPAELSGTLKLRTAQQLENSYQDFRQHILHSLVEAAREAGALSANEEMQHLIVGKRPPSSDL